MISKVLVSRPYRAMLRLVTTCCLILAISGCASSSKELESIARGAGVLLESENGGLALTSSEITRGLKEALMKSSQVVVAQVGKQDGYAGDSRIRVPLPRDLVRAKDFASRVGLGGFFDDLELKLNRAAERAAPRARDLFYNAIRQMTLEDAKGILKGPDDAATRYFEQKTSSRLRQAMRPIVDDSLSQVGAVNTFNEMLRAYRQVPLAPPVNADLTTHVIDEGLEGLFYYIAKEEKEIRNNPLKRTTQLLQRVFGSRL